MGFHIIKLLSILVFLQIIPYSFSYSWTGYAIQDLNKNDSSFSYDVQRWTSSIFLQGLEYTVCSGTYLLGGYGIIGQAGIPATDIYLQRTYTQLSSTHTMIYFSFTLWALDTWNGNSGDSFQLEFDLRIMTGWMFNMLNFPMGNKVCGVSQARDLNNLRVFGRVYHTGTTLLFKLRSELDQWPTDESFGIRDLNLLFVETPTTTRENVCAIAPISLSSNQCLCPEGQYEAIPGSGTCTNCDSRCKSCFAGDSKSCYECAPGTYFNGQACVFCPEYCAICTGEAANQCIICQPGYYMLVVQGICLKTCTYPLSIFYTGTIPYCQAPFCSSSNFLRWDGTCSPTCATPLQQSFIGTLRLCINPCSIGEYLYWDGSCRQSCPSPLQINAQTGVNYCDTNCAGYFYDDGTCSTTCTSPLVPKTHGIRLFCTYPCDGNQYLFGNSSCGDACPPPWTAREANGLRYCDFNCLSTEYLAWNGSCTSTCDSPLIKDVQSVGTLCLPPCRSIDIYYYVSTGTCSEKCNMQAVLDRQDLYPKCLSVAPPDDTVTIVNPLITASTKPNGVTFVTLTRLIHPLRYLDVEFPPRLQTLVSYPTRSPLCITPFIAIPDRVKAHFSQQEIPTIYSDRGVHSSFFVNFWQETISFFIVAAAVITLGCLEKTSEKCGSNCLQVFFERLRVIFGCSYFFILFGSSAGDIVFFAFLELRAFNWSYVLGVFSFGMTMFILGMLGIFINKVLNVTAKIQKSKKDAFFNRSDGLYMSTLIQWQNYQIFFRGFKQHFKPNNYFYFIYLTRIICPMAIAAFLYRIPILQTSLYVLINLLIIGYIVFAQPLRSTLNFIQLLLIETLTLIINIAILVLAASTNSSSTSEKKVFLGDLIILGNDVINATLGIFFILKFFFGMRNACRLKTIQAEANQDAWYQLLFIPLQQGGLGFERARVARFPRIHVKHTDNKMDLLQEKEDEGIADNDSFIYYKEYADYEKDTTISSNNLKEEELISQRKPRVKYLPGEEDEVEVFGITRKDENDEEEDLNEAIEKATEALAISVIPGFKPRRKKHIDPEDDLSMPTYENELTVQPFDLNQSSFFPMSNTNQDYENYDLDNQLPTVDQSKHLSYVPKAPLDEDEMRRKMSGINEVDEEEEKADSPQKSARSVKDDKEGTAVLGARLVDIDQELPEAPPLKNSETPKKIKEKLKTKTPKKSKETIKSETLKEILKDHETPKNPKKKNETPKNIKVTNQPAPSRDDAEDEDDVAIIEKMILPELPEKDEKMVEIEKQFLENQNKDNEKKIKAQKISKKEKEEEIYFEKQYLEDTKVLKETPIEMEIMINPTKEKKEMEIEKHFIREERKAKETPPPAVDEMEIFMNYTKEHTEKESNISTTRKLRKTAREIAAEVDSMMSSKRDHIEVPKPKPKKADVVDIEKQFLESATPEVKVKKTAKEIAAEMDILLNSTREGKTQPQRRLMQSVMESQKMSGQQSNRIADPDKDFEQTFLQANKNEMSKFFVSNKDSARTYDSQAFAPRKDKQKNPDDITVMNASFTSELADIFTKKK